MDNNIDEKIMDKLTKVCLCKAISRATIKKAIEQGADTVEKVNISTGSGSGGCKGNSCSEKIQRLIDNYNK